MIRSRYIGSTRARESGFSATHKQDFIAHVTGGDWIHLASQISVTGAYENLQAELDAIESAIAIVPQVVANAGGSTNNAIAIFNGTTGRQITQPSYPTVLDATYGDIIMPANTGFNLITTAITNSSLQAQSLHVFAQNNQGGQGGSLIIGCGFNGVSGAYDADVLVVAPRLNFDYAIPNPTITQVSINAATANDLIISAQSNLSSSGTAGSLWLESGTNGSGQAGNIYLRSYPGTINISTTGIVFDAAITSPPVIHQSDISSGTGSAFYIAAQNTLSGVGGALRLSSGAGSLGQSGDIYLDAKINGTINLISPLLNFDAGVASPKITQAKANNTTGNDFWITSQSNSSGTAGNLWLETGSSDVLGTHGTIHLVAKDGGVVFDTTNINFEATSQNVTFRYLERDTAAAGQIWLLGQSIPTGASNVNGVPGNVYIVSGSNPNNNTSGVIYLSSGLSPTVLFTSTLMFGSSYTNPIIKQGVYNSGPANNGNAQPLRIVAQENTNGRGGDLMLFSGPGYTDSAYQPNIEGDYGNININASFGQVNIGGSSFGGTAGVNISGGLYIKEGVPSGNPVGGVFLYVSSGVLYWRDSSGTNHAV